MAWVATKTNTTTTNTTTNTMGRDAAAFDGRTADRGVVQTFLARVYTFMALGLGITGIVALAVATSPTAMAFIFGGRWILMALIGAELLLVMAFAPVAARASAGVAGLMLLVYSVLNGVTMASIFMVYTRGSIGGTFLVTGATFGALAAYGTVTKRDLSSLGSFAMMGLVGLVIASVVNLFLGNPMLYWLTTFVGVIVFTGLTVYDTAKLKTIATLSAGQGREAETKLALQGALSLYLDFINLFLMLLRLFGGGRRRN
jgi:FtsH-binding integral membrane protein